METHLEVTEYSQGRPFAFISYASRNWEAVFPSAVVPLQKQYGLRVYVDKALDMVDGKWIVPILRNVRGADLMLAFVSQSYIESYACFLELLTAVNSRKPVLFVSLGEPLHLGDATARLCIERDARKEILHQGSELVANTDPRPNDAIQAMQPAYTSLSTLLEQDMVSKYDISAAFLTFFQGSPINQRAIHDLGAVADAVKSISEDVFDLSLVVESPC